MKNILNFNIEATKEKLTPRSGVIIFGEYLKGLELEALINKSNDYSKGAEAILKSESCEQEKSDIEEYISTYGKNKSSKMGKQKHK